MARSTRDAWLTGEGDLAEADVEDVPRKGMTVRVRGLPAAYSNQASSEALELITGRRGEQIATVNTAKLEVIQFAHGCIDPKFTLEEAEQVAQRYGPAFKKVIAEIDRLSGVDKEAIEEANARFPDSGGGSPGTAAEPVPAGNSRPDLPS